SMERKQKPIIIVDESRFHFVFHRVGLAVELRAVICDFNGLAFFIVSFVGNLAGLRLPLPRVRKFEYSGNFPVPGIANRLNLIPRIDTVGRGNLFENWRALLCPGVCSKEKHCETQKVDHRYTVRIDHGLPLDEIERIRSEMMRRGSNIQEFAHRGSKPDTLSLVEHCTPARVIRRKQIIRAAMATHPYSSSITQPGRGPHGRPSARKCHWT